MNKKILIVDDNKTLCETLAKIIENEGYIVECSFNGKNTIKLLENNHYDALIIDYKLPDVSGWKILQNYHNNKKFPAAIMISAYADNFLQRRATEENILLIDKPFDNSELITALNSITNIRKNAL